MGARQPHRPRRVSASCSHKHLSKDEQVEWQRAAPPARLGRPALAEGVRRHRLERGPAAHLRGGCARRRRAAQSCRSALNMVGPVLMASSAPRRRRSASCRASYNGEDWWCQGYSEPGSAPTWLAEDHAPCATATTTSSTARRPGPRWASTPTGSSAWCAPTRAAKQQEGISFLLIDMKTPGITVRPIITHRRRATRSTRSSSTTCKVPVENLVDEENKGWTYAKYLLGHERTGIARVGALQARADAAEGASPPSETTDGRPLLEDPRFREQASPRSRSS